MRRASLVAAIAAVGLTGVACSDRPVGPSDPAPPEGPSISVLAATLTLDDAFVNVTRDVPGFAGVYLGPDGEIVVRGAQAPDEAALVAALEEEAVLGDLGDRVRDGRAAGRLRYEPATYDFGELYRWQRAIGHAGMADIAWTDVDEVANRVVVGLNGSRTSQASLLAELGVPAGAVQFVENSRATPTATLRNYVRPLLGGLEIAGYGVCTMTVAGNASGASGFVTNAHCSSTFATFDGTPFYQGGSYVGFEAIDPAPNGGPTYCQASNPCRRADWAWVSSGLGVKGTIARTTGLGSITISSANPRFEVSRSLSPMVVGQAVNKMGRSSGWTQGTITRTCINVVNWLGLGIDLACQSEANYGQQDGDSGAPVFIWNGSMGNTAILVGIHTGTLNGTGLAFFGEWRGVYNEAVWSGYFLDVDYGEDEQLPCEGQCFPEP